MAVDERLVERWIALQRAEPDSSEHELLFDAFERVWKLTKKRPDDAWDFILAVLERDSSNEIMGNLAAGPLEDLLNHHGRKIIVRVEAQAKRDPLFARLLGGVWRNSISNRVWRRVEAARDPEVW